MSVGTQPSMIETGTDVHPSYAEAPIWLYNLRVLWERRVLLLRVTGIALVCSLIVAFAFPNTYVSQARIMPPEMTGGGLCIACGDGWTSFRERCTRGGCGIPDGCS